nr:serine hydrolase domain-containing protein [Hyphomonas sp. Mor2]
MFKIVSASVCSSLLLVAGFGGKSVAQICDVSVSHISSEQNRSEFMRGVPPSRELIVSASDEWYKNEDQASWAFQNSSLIHKVAVISRGVGPAQELPCAASGILNNTYANIDGKAKPLSGILSELNVDGFIALHKGEIIGEAYFNGFAPDKRHIVFSVTKSILGTLAGVMVGRGELDPQSLVTGHLPELIGSGFDGARVQDLLDMVAGAEWDKVRSDPSSLVNVNAMAGAFIEAPNDFEFGNTLEFLASLGPQRPHGEKYVYNASNTEALAWIVSRAAGQAWQDELSERIWTKIGADKDAVVVVDPYGHGFATAGLSATLRDLARFASLYLASSDQEDHAIIPGAWIEDILADDPKAREHWQSGSDAERRPLDAYYKNHIRVLDPAAGEFYASGFMGQKLYINRKHDFVAVFLSTVSDRAVIDFHVPLIRQVIASLEIEEEGQ